ncbi:PQQ-binding-like beta-propeller repeat protein [Sphingobacterium detergens]|uniref:outer membrane protein assembly factor BamB family protein n=1 Tax=Sphingobacterium detergens TaxID=1145106 RepID=UPI003AADA330
MKLIKLLAYCLFPIPSLFAQQRTGRVFEDQNGNNQFEQNEKQLAGIVVSDGYDVVKTDNTGTYTLPHNPSARFLFVTIPSGYKATKTHYIPLRAEHKNLDFALTKDAVQQTDFLRFIQITDTETPLYGPWIDNVRNYAQQQKASLIMHTGDICYEPGMLFHAKQVNSELMGRPTYYTVGNHDLVKGEYGEKLFEDLFGPTYYSFDAGPAHFVVTPMPNGDYKPSYTADQIIAWLKKDLATMDRSKPLIFINHDFFAGPDFILKGEKEQIDLMQYNLKAWFYGHWHNNFAFKQKGVYVVCSNAPNKGGIDNSAAQFVVVDIDKQGIKDIKPIYTNLRDHIQLVHPTADQQIGAQEALPIVISAYDSERKIQKVAVEISAHEMGKRLANVQLSPSGDWLWQAKVPFGKQKGQYDALITIHYENGEQALKRQSFNLAGHAESTMKLQWSAAVNGNIWKTSPLIVGDKLFVATMDDGIGTNHSIIALDKRTGKTLWSLPTINSIKHKLRYSDGILLATDVETNIYAIDANTGKILWTKKTSNPSLPTFVSGPALDNGIYYAGLGKRMSAIDIHTGKVLWEGVDPSGGEATPAELSVVDQTLLAGYNWNALCAYDIQTGKLLWKRQEDGLRFRSGGVTAKDGYLYTTGLNGIFKLNLKTGEIAQKSIKTDDFKVMASPKIVEDLLVMPTSTNGIKAYDPQTLEEKWHFSTGEALVYTSPYSSPDQHKLVGTVESSVTEAKGTFFFGASDGYVYALNKQGKLLSKFNLGAPIFSEITVDGDFIYIADFAGNVSCFKF